MYVTDISTGSTLFTLRGKTRAQTVVLETFGQEQRVRIPMRCEAAGWTAQLALPPGWCFYRFEVDGEYKCDRVTGKCRTTDGQPCSLAIINGCPRLKTVPPNN